MVMIPGWSQAAAQFKHQLAGLSERYRVIALDMRGHGASEKPAHGYRIARLAKDVHDALVALDLDDVTLMGRSVIWSYWDLFGAERLAKLVLVDQMPFITSNPAWSEEEKEAAGPLVDAEGLYNLVNALAGPQGFETTRDFVTGGMFTDAMPEEDKAWVLELNLKLPREHAATLVYNHATQDWRDLIPRIDIPTLIVSGRVSLVPWKSQVWIHEQIPGAQLEMFEEVLVSRPVD